MSTREDFEAWLATDFDRDPWAIWQAAYALATERAAKVCKDQGRSFMVPSYIAACDNCAAAIRAGSEER